MRQVEEFQKTQKMLQDTKKCRLIEKAVLSETAVIQQQVEDAGIYIYIQYTYMVLYGYTYQYYVYNL